MSLEQINFRIRIIYIILIILFLYLGLRLFYVQILKHSEYSQMAERQRSYGVELAGPRGIIYDRNDTPLAINQECVSVYAMPQEFTRQTFDDLNSLARLLDISPDDLNRQVKSHHSFFWIKRKLPIDTLDKVKGLKIPGIGWVKEEDRSYPQETLAAQVLGFTGVDNQGLEGIEKFYDPLLAGNKGEAVFQYDAKGNEIFSQRRILKEPKAGKNLHLTLDLYLQHLAEKELLAAMNRSHAQRGTVIILDPNNGEILANAIAPSYDPNHYNRYPASVRKNWAVTDLYEPGSTFKVFTVASALQEGIISETSSFRDDGFYAVGDRVIKNYDSYEKIHGLISVSEVLRLSSNIGAAQIGLLLPKDHFRKYLVDFGFGSKTGVDFPGESPGLIPKIRDWNSVVQSNISFGQGIAITPLELLCATASVANGGAEITPHFLKEDLENKPPKKKGAAPVSTNVIQKVKAMMVKVVEKGTGKAASLQYYTVAGKTGTAQKAEPGSKGYLPDQYVVSFVGFLPAENPRLVILVVFDEPLAPYQQGGMLAAPVFKAVAEQSARYLNIPPSRTN